MFETIAIGALVVSAISAIGSCVWAWSIRKQNKREQHPSEGSGTLPPAASTGKDEPTSSELGSHLEDTFSARNIQEFAWDGAHYDAEMFLPKEQGELIRQIEAAVQPPLPNMGRGLLAEQGPGEVILSSIDLSSNELVAALDLVEVVSDFEAERAAIEQAQPDIEDSLRNINLGRK
jgi:hypothetical protein